MISTRGYTLFLFIENWRKIERLENEFLISYSGITNSIESNLSLFQETLDGCARCKLLFEPSLEVIEFFVFEMSDSVKDIFEGFFRVSCLSLESDM